VERKREAGEHLLGRRRAAAELEAEHGSEVREQLARPRVLRMRWKREVVHAGDGLVLLEELRHLPRGGALLPEAHAQRLEAALEQEAGVRVERPAQVIEGLLGLAHALGR